VKQKIQTSRDGPPAVGDLELSNVSGYGGSRHWRVARISSDVGGGVAGIAFAGVPDDFDNRFVNVLTFFDDFSANIHLFNRRKK
jgi:hypothetical protein